MVQRARSNFAKTSLRLKSVQSLDQIKLEFPMLKELGLSLTKWIVYRVCCPFVFNGCIVANG